MDEKQQRMVMLSIGVASMWPVLLSVGSKSGRSLLTEQLRIHLSSFLRFIFIFHLPISSTAGCCGQRVAELGLKCEI